MIAHHHIVFIVAMNAEKSTKSYTVGNGVIKTVTPTVNIKEITRGHIMQKQCLRCNRIISGARNKKYCGTCRIEIQSENRARWVNNNREYKNKYERDYYRWRNEQTTGKKTI
jgi:hypothetical protein